MTTTKSTKADLDRARMAIETVLDAMLGPTHHEWHAYKSIMRALMSETATAPSANGAVKIPGHRVRPGQPLPYTALTAQLLNIGDEPCTTPEIIEYISQHRTLDDDREKAKINITSTLSKSDKFKSVPWHGGTAWWFADRPVPK